MKEFVDSIKSVDGGTIKVVKQDLGIRIGKVDLSKPKKAVLHTTEGFTLPAYTSGAPTIDVGPRLKGQRPILRQLIPFGWMATAMQNDAGGVETNRNALVQIEQVGFTSREVWLPNKEMVVIVASLADFFEKEFGIPQKYPYDPRDVATGVWATESNPWRRAAKFNTVAGWHAHIAVPENDHWDCGGEDISEILGMKPTVQKVTAFQLTAVWTERQAENAVNHRHVEPVSPHFMRKAKLQDWLAKDDDEIRQKVWDHMKVGHKLYIAERRVDTDKVVR